MFECSDNKKLLIIITGISASGKSTLAEKVAELYVCSIFSLDSFKVEVYEEYGFLNETERLLLRDLAICKFKAEIVIAARQGIPIVVDYCFDSSWQVFFNTISKVYDYRLIIVNCNSRDFDDIWNSRILRDSNFTLREKCLTASAYVKDELYKFNNKLNKEYKETKRKEYESDKYTSLQGEFVFTDKEFSSLFL